MNSLFSKIASAATSSDDQEGEKGGDSSSGLFSSVKVVSEAAQTVYSTKSMDDVDKPKVAGAAEDLLDSVSQYGHLKENETYGQYVEKAQTYLHSYTQSTTTETVKTKVDDQLDTDDVGGSPPKQDVEDVNDSSPKPSGGGGDEEEEVNDSAPKPSRGGGGDEEEEVNDSAPKPSRGGGGDDDEEESGGTGGGYGGYMKMAQGLLQKD